jgi:adenosylmethionine-8-amino-7-oxononanoate aminotransferase
VRNARSHGVILAFELAIEANRYGNIRNSIYEWFMQQGVYIRPLGTTIYWVPPFITSPKEMDILFQTTRQFLDEFEV